jgi:hypothetical protein
VHSMQRKEEVARIHMAAALRTQETRQALGLTGFPLGEARGQIFLLLAVVATVEAVWWRR